MLTTNTFTYLAMASSPSKLLITSTIMIVYVFVFLKIGFYKNLNDFTRNIILYAPLGFIIIIGSYLFVKLCNGVFSIKDCKNAWINLCEDIEEANKDLKQKGFFSNEK